MVCKRIGKSYVQDLERRICSLESMLTTLMISQFWAPGVWFDPSPPDENEESTIDGAKHIISIANALGASSIALLPDTCTSEEEICPDGAEHDFALEGQLAFVPTSGDPEARADLEHGDCEEQDVAEVVQTAGGTLPGIDALGMVLPVSVLTDVAGRGQNFPLKLHRECFVAQLLANADLLVSIEFGFETGSAYRQHWQKVQHRAELRRTQWRATGA